MTAPRAGLVPALVGTLVGPVAVLLYESGGLHLFRAMPLLNVWIVVALGGCGFWVGVRAFRRGITVLGAICLLANGAVLGLYGFLATFFALGGSR